MAGIGGFVCIEDANIGEGKSENQIVFLLSFFKEFFDSFILLMLS